MIVNYTLNRTLHLLFTKRQEWLSFYLCFMLTILISLGLEITVDGVGRVGGAVHMIQIFRAIIGIVITCAFIYALERRYGDEKPEDELLSNLWAGLCFAPGFILSSFIVSIVSLIGLLLFIVPGLYYGVRNYLNPYYTIINSDNDRPQKAYPHSFRRTDFVDILKFGLAGLFMTGLPTAVGFFIETTKITVLRVLYTPVEALTLVITTAMTYYFINYLERVRRN